MIIKLNNILDLFSKNLLKKKTNLIYISLVFSFFFLSLFLFLIFTTCYSFLSFFFLSLFLPRLYLTYISLHSLTIPLYTSIIYIFISPFHHACIILHVAKKIVIISFVYKLIHTFYKNRIFRPTF